jgi:hemolysin D
MRRVLSILRHSLALERAAGPAPSRRPDERAFLPAVLEVTETPPSPSARWLTWTLVAFFCLALGWAWLGRVDEVAIAEGRTVASGRSKVVQPAESGIVTAIHVRDGQAVREGDVLIELDSTITGADRDRLRQDLLAAELNAARLTALLAATGAGDGADGGGDPVALFAPPAMASRNPARLAGQRALLRAEVEEQRARQAGLRDEIRRRQAERATTEAAIRRLGDTIPLIQARAEARGELARDGHGSRLIFLEARQLLVEAQHERIIQTHRLAEADAAIAVLLTQLRSQAAEFARTRQGELADAERQATALTQELVKAEQRQSQQRLLAPIDGTVQQLAVHTIGGVVQPAQQLLVVAPRDDRLELEALVLNRDIGFVQHGQLAEVKLEAFTFTRFGLVPGEVVSVSGDAIADERRGLVYAARIRLLEESITVNGQATPLVPGMAATAEIRTGSRRVLDYLLSPIARYRQEAMRER